MLGKKELHSSAAKKYRGRKAALVWVRELYGPIFWFFVQLTGAWFSTCSAIKWQVKQNVPSTLLEESYMALRNKTILTIMLTANIISMFFNWFGFIGLNEMRGTMVLFNPITLLCILLFIVGVWYPFKETKLNAWMPLLSIIGIMGLELRELISWHFRSGLEIVDILFNLTGSHLAFHIGFTISIMILFLVVSLNRKLLFAK